MDKISIFLLSSIVITAVFGSYALATHPSSCISESLSKNFLACKVPFTNKFVQCYSNKTIYLGLLPYCTHNFIDNPFLTPSIKINITLPNRSTLKFTPTKLIQNRFLVPGKLNVSITPLNTTITNNSTSTWFVTVSGGTQPYVYLWNIINVSNSVVETCTFSVTNICVPPIPQPSAPNLTYTPTTIGNYTLNLTVTDALLTTATTQTSFTVINSTTIIPVNIITNNTNETVDIINSSGISSSSTNFNLLNQIVGITDNAT